MHRWRRHPVPVPRPQAVAVAFRCADGRLAYGAVYGVAGRAYGPAPSADDLLIDAIAFAGEGEAGQERGDKEEHQLIPYANPPILSPNPAKSSPTFPLECP